MRSDEPRKPSTTEPVASRPVERRSARGEHDWESIALLRVARRVRSLTEPGSVESWGRTADRYGWEEIALRNLSRRLKDRGAS